MEHFGPGIELLDVNTEDDGVVNFTCFTEKQINLNNEGKHSIISFWLLYYINTDISCIEEATSHFHRR